MMCYKDITFCGYKSCCDWKSCARARTEKVKLAAKKAKLWIAVYGERPKCYKSKLVSGEIKRGKE